MGEAGYAAMVSSREGVSDVASCPRSVRLLIILRRTTDYHALLPNSLRRGAGRYRARLRLGAAQGWPQPLLWDVIHFPMAARSYRGGIGIRHLYYHLYILPNSQQLTVNITKHQKLTAFELCKVTLYSVMIPRIRESTNIHRS